MQLFESKIYFACRQNPSASLVGEHDFRHLAAVRVVVDPRSVVVRLAHSNHRCDHGASVGIGAADPACRSIDAPDPRSCLPHARVRGLKLKFFSVWVQGEGQFFVQNSTIDRLKFQL